MVGGRVIMGVQTHVVRRRLTDARCTIAESAVGLAAAFLAAKENVLPLVTQSTHPTLKRTSRHALVHGHTRTCLARRVRGAFRFSSSCEEIDIIVHACLSVHNGVCPSLIILRPITPHRTFSL